MVKIRLARHGDKNDPFYRIVVIDQKSKREGKPLEVIGYWHPKKSDKKIDKKKYESWLNKGAVATEAVKKIIK